MFLIYTLKCFECKRIGKVMALTGDVAAIQASPMKAMPNIPLLTYRLEDKKHGK